MTAKWFDSRPLLRYVGVGTDSESMKVGKGSYVLGRSLSARCPPDALLAKGTEPGMSFSVGIDLQPIAEVESSLTSFGARYTRLLYTSAELTALGDDPYAGAQRLAAIFATKEAVMKVLAPSQEIPSWLDIEVRDLQSDSASVALRRVAAELATQLGVSELIVTLGAVGGCAAAIAVAQTSNCCEAQE